MPTRPSPWQSAPCSRPSRGTGCAPRATCVSWTMGPSAKTGGAASTSCTMWTTSSRTGPHLPSSARSMAHRLLHGKKWTTGRYTFAWRWMSLSFVRVQWPRCQQLNWWCRGRLRWRPPRHRLLPIQGPRAVQQMETPPRKMGVPYATGGSTSGPRRQPSADTCSMWTASTPGQRGGHRAPSAGGTCKWLQSLRAWASSSSLLGLVWVPFAL